MAASSSKPVALITGSSRGIGRGIALELGRRGYAVVVNYVRSAEAAEQVVREIEASGGQAVAVRGDVASADDRAALVEAALERFGRLDLLVNNAGITSQGRKDLLEADEASWNVVFDTNLKGPFFLAQRSAKAMIELRQQGAIERGTIVNVSSISTYEIGRAHV